MAKLRFTQRSKLMATGNSEVVGLILKIASYIITALAGFFGGGTIL